MISGAKNRASNLFSTFNLNINIVITLLLRNKEAVMTMLSLQDDV